MIKQIEILTEINRLLVSSFQEYAVYINACPKDFIRPSFLLEFVRLSRTDANFSTVEKTAYYTITCFTPVDNYYQSNAEDLINLQDGVMQLFLQGYINVGDRAIKVKSSTGGMDIDRAYIDLQFEYFDNRTDEEDETPLITSVTTRI